MHQPKYRARLFGNGAWVFGGGYQMVQGYCAMIAVDHRGALVIHKVDIDTVAEFTGKLDILKREIYERDLVTGRIQDCDPLTRWVVKREDFGFIFHQLGTNVKVRELKDIELV